MSAPAPNTPRPRTSVRHYLVEYLDPDHGDDTILTQAKVDHNSSAFAFAMEGQDNTRSDEPEHVKRAHALTIIVAETLGINPEHIYDITEVNHNP